MYGVDFLENSTFWHTNTVSKIEISISLKSFSKNTSRNAYLITDNKLGFWPESPFRFQMPPKTHWLHAVYVLVKSFIPKVQWLVFSSLPCVFCLDKICLPFRDKLNLWRWRWLVLPPFVRGWSLTPAFVNGPRFWEDVHLSFKFY